MKHTIIKWILGAVIGIGTFTGCLNRIQDDLKIGMNGFNVVSKFEITDPSTGETHEFIHIWTNHINDVEHWPGCKYCKEHNHTEP